jgi:hypothetical protein
MQPSAHGLFPHRLQHKTQNEDPANKGVRCTQMFDPKRHTPNFGGVEFDPFKVVMQRT